MSVCGVCVWGGGECRVAVVQSTHNLVVCVCVWCGGGGVEWQSCSQRCAGRMGAVCVCMLGMGGGLEGQSCGQHTLHKNTDTLHSETLSRSLSKFRILFLPVLLGW